MAQQTRAKKVNLAKLFGAVANSMGEQRESLNQADTYNNDHGDHMVEIFEVVTQAVKEKKNLPPADQLAYASEILRRRQSGSAQVYANGFAQAAQQFQGQAVTTDNAGMLIQALLGGGQSPMQPAGAGGDMLGTLLGGLTGQTQGMGQAAPQATGAGGDMIGALLGGLTGQTSQQQPGDNALDLGDLLNAGMAFMNAKQQGSSTAEAAINALMSASPLGQSSHRKESGAMVANTLLQVLGAMTKK